MASSKMDDFRDLLGSVPDEKVAELADVRVETVAGWRKKLGIEAFSASDSTADEEPGETNPDRGTWDLPPRMTEPAEPAPKPVKAPRCVRVTRTAIIKRADNRTWRVRFRDVYHGEEAAFLWERHRDLVEAYP